MGDLVAVALPQLVKVLFNQIDTAVFSIHLHQRLQHRLRKRSARIKRTDVVHQVIDTVQTAVRCMRVEHERQHGQLRRVRLPARLLYALVQVPLAISAVQFERKLALIGILAILLHGQHCLNGVVIAGINW